MATNERVINRSIWTTKRRFVDPQNVYDFLEHYEPKFTLPMNNNHDTKIYNAHIITSSNIRVLMSCPTADCRSLILATCESNELTRPPSYMCLFVGGCTVITID